MDKLSPIQEYYRYRHGISTYTDKADISNNELHFMLTLAPAYYAQKIYLVVNVVNAAFDFQILQSL